MRSKWSPLPTKDIAAQLNVSPDSAIGVVGLAIKEVELDVQVKSDDNLGPYFFVPRVNLSKIIDAIIVPLPVTQPIVGPKHAERAAYKGIAKWVGSLREDDPRIIFARSRLCVAGAIAWPNSFANPRVEFDEKSR
jgi:hypothetical protein